MLAFLHGGPVGTFPCSGPTSPAYHPCPRPGPHSLPILVRVHLNIQGWSSSRASSAGQCRGNDPTTTSSGSSAFVGPAQGPASLSRQPPQSICQPCSGHASPSPSLCPGILGTKGRTSGILLELQSGLVLPEDAGAAHAALPALSTLSTCLHDALEEHGVILHVGVLG